MRENVIREDVIEHSHRKKPHFVVTHEYSGSQSMQTVFEQVIENEIHRHFERWRKSKTVKKSS